MLLLLNVHVALPLNSCHAHVGSSNNYTHALTVVTRLYFSFTEPGYEALNCIEKKKRSLYWQIARKSNRVAISTMVTTNEHL